VAALPGKRRDDVYGLKYEFLLDYGGGDVQDGEYWPAAASACNPAALRLLESVHPNALSLEQRWVTGTNLPVTKPTRARKGRKRPRTAAEQDGQWRANKTSESALVFPCFNTSAQRNDQMGAAKEATQSGRLSQHQARRTQSAWAQAEQQRRQRQWRRQSPPQQRSACCR